MQRRQQEEQLQKSTRMNSKKNSSIQQNPHGVDDCVAVAGAVGRVENVNQLHRAHAQSRVRQSYALHPAIELQRNVDMSRWDNAESVPRAITGMMIVRLQQQLLEMRSVSTAMDFALVLKAQAPHAKRRVA
jgi:hypothetical protein